MIFARKSDDALASLAKQLDKAITDNKDARLASYINLLNEDRDAAIAHAEEFARANKIENIPIVVPTEFKSGPENFGIHPDAEVTVTLHVGLKVKATHAFKAGGLDKKAIEAIIADLSKIVEKK